MKDFYNAMLATAESAGIKILSDDFCCKLLAFLLVYGGGLEAVTQNYKLNTDIQYAQKRLNLFGGEKPDKELVPLFQQYHNEIKDMENRPQRLIELYNKYQIKL